MANQSEIVVTGSCACGRITYTSNDTPRPSSYCYCAECRKVSGGAYLAFANIRTDSLHWNVEPDLWKSSKFAERGLCSLCGTSLFMRYYMRPETTGIVYGSIDECKVPLDPPVEHIFLNEKPSWFKVPDDGAPRYDRFDPTFSERLRRWKATQMMEQTE